MLSIIQTLNTQKVLLLELVTASSIRFHFVYKLLAYGFGCLVIGSGSFSGGVDRAAGGSAPSQ